ncbi:MAG TPA: muconolactone Delta-isomerase family protein [Chloroflexota bacterium]
MRFLIHSQPRVGANEELVAQLYPKAVEWLKARKSEGKLEAVYSFADRPGGVSIANVQSLEELNDLIQDYPLFPVSDLEAMPLIDFERASQRTLTKIRELERVLG